MTTRRIRLLLGGFGMIHPPTDISKNINSDVAFTYIQPPQSTTSPPLIGPNIRSGRDGLLMQTISPHPSRTLSLNNRDDFCSDSLRKHVFTTASVLPLRCCVQNPVDGFPATSSD